MNPVRPRTRVTYDPYDADLWGEPEGPPLERWECRTCGVTVTRKSIVCHTCENPVFRRLEGSNAENQ